MDENKSAIENARQDEQIKTLFTNVGKIENRLDGVEKIASNVERLALSVETMAKSMDVMEKKVDGLTAEPASAWKNFKWILVGVLTTGIVGGVVAALFSLISK